MKETKKHGGARPGAGKPPKDPTAGKRVKTSITLTKEHFEFTAGNRSEIIEAALNIYKSQR